MPKKIQNRTAHFWSKVDRRGPDECWPWTAGTYANGYGQLEFDRRKLRAHRYAAWLCGIVETPHAPPDLRSEGFVLHSCDNRLCCNPNHLRSGTLQDNRNDALTRNRWRKRWPHRFGWHMHNQMHRHPAISTAEPKHESKRI